MIQLSTENTQSSNIRNLFVRPVQILNSTITIQIYGGDNVDFNPSSLSISDQQQYRIEVKLLTALQNNIVTVPCNVYVRSNDDSITEYLHYTIFFSNAQQSFFIFSPQELTFFLDEYAVKEYSIKTTTYPSSIVHININNTCPESYSLSPMGGTLLANDNILRITVSPLTTRVEGSCTINHIITTGDVDYSQFDVVPFTINTFYEDRTPAPLIVSAIENDNENTITITFSKECFVKDDDGGKVLYKKFNCSDLIKVTNSVNTSHCRWLNDEEIILYYNSFDYTANSNMHQITVEPEKIYGNTTGVYYTIGTVDIKLRKVPPKLKEGKYNDEYSIIYVSYIDSVNSQIEFGLDENGRKCSEIFKEKELLGNSFCYLDRINKNIVIELTVDSEIIIPLSSPSTSCVADHSLTLINNTIKPVQNSILYMFGCVNIYKPSNMLSYTAYISQYPETREITECQDVILDASISTFGNQKLNSRLLDYKWNVLEEDDSGNITDTNVDLHTYIDNQRSSVVKIPSHLLIPSYTYKFIVAVTCSVIPGVTLNEAILDATTDSIMVPIIEAEHNNIISMRSNEDRFIRGKTMFDSCNFYNDKNLNIEYIWKIEFIDHTSVVIDPFKTKDPTVLHIKPNTLLKGRYNVILESIVLSMNDGNVIERKSTSVKLYVNDNVDAIPLKVISNIKQSVIQSNNDPIFIDLNVIDEEDLDNNQFSFVWSCTNSKFERCKEMNHANEIPLDLSSNGTYSIYIENDHLLLSEYIFTVEITGTITSRKTKIMIAVTVTDSNTINSVDSIYHTSIDSYFLSPSAYSENDIIKLESQLHNDNNSNNDISFEWKYLYNDRKDIMMSSNDSYIAYFNCKNMNKRTSTHLIEFTIHNHNTLVNITQYYPFYIINSIPSEGYMQYQTNEITFGEKLYISTAGWKGFKPFTYRYGVILNYNDFDISDEEKSEIIYLQSEYSNSNSYYGILPSGLRENSYKVRIIVFVKDTYNQVGYTYYDVKGNVVNIKVKPYLNIDNVKDEVIVLNNYQEYDDIMSVALSLSMHIPEVNTQILNCSSHGILSNGVCFCDDSYVGRLCEKHKPIDGGLSNSYTYSSWSNSCGYVMRYKYKECNNPRPQYGGKKCNITVETDYEIKDPCTSNNNNNNPAFTGWSGWSECDAYCSIYNGKRSYGTKYRTRNCIGSKYACENQHTYEVQECFKVCKEPLKLCPGQFINETGGVVGNICNNKGVCHRNRDDCGEYEPNCHSWCVCDDGFDGNECQYTINEYNFVIDQNRYIVDNLIKSIYNNRVHDSFNSDIELELIINYLLNINYMKNMNEQIINDLFDIIKDKLTNMKNNKYSKIPFNILRSFTHIASNLINYEWNKINIVNNTNDQYRIGKQLKQFFIDLSYIHFNQQYSSEISIKTNMISISLIKADISYNDKNMHKSVGFSDNSIDVYDGLDLSRDTEILLIYWNDLFFYTQNDIYSSILTVIIDNNMNNNRMMLRALSNDNNNNRNKIVYKQRIIRNVDEETVSCAYFNTNNELSILKSSLIGIDNEDSNKTEYAICVSYNQADFVFTKSNVEGDINSLLPIQFSNLLGLFDKYNFYILIPYLLSILIFIVLLYFAYKEDSDEIDDIEFISTNRIKDNGRLDVLSNSELKRENNQDNMGKKIFKKLIVHHSLLAPICKKARDLVTISRFQHVLCIAAEIYTLFCCVAIFYGNFHNLENATTITLLCALIIFPLNVILPYIYNKLRNYFASSVAPTNIPTMTLWLTIKRIWKIYRYNNYNEMQSEMSDSPNDSVENNTNPLFITIGSDGFSSRRRSNFSVNIDKNPFFNLKVYLYVCTILLLLFNIIFFFIFSIVFPFGPPFLFMYITLFVLILEATFTFYCTTYVTSIYYVYDMMCYFVEMTFYGFLLYTYFDELVVGNSMMKNLWKLLYDSNLFKDIISYAENSLNCCGYSNKFVTRTCSMDSVPCSGEIHNIFIQYAPMWMIFLFISIIMMLMKLYFVLRIVCYKFNSIGVLGAGVINVDVFNTSQTRAVSRIHYFLKYTIAKKKRRRIAESIAYKKANEERRYMSLMIDVVLVFYIILMLFFSFDYGLKFSLDHLLTWLYTVSISYCLDIIIQQPSAIMFYTVVRNVLSSYITKRV